MAQPDSAQQEVTHWLGALTDLTFDEDELLAATRLAQLMTVQRKLDSITLRQFEADGISGTNDFRLLALLRRHQPNGLTNADLVTALAGSKSGISNQLDRLVVGGVIERATLPHDRRTHANLLTTHGEAVADQLLIAIAEARHKMFANLSRQQIALLSETLAEILHEVAPDD